MENTSSWPVIGHAAAVELLRRSIETRQVGHAYLFSGPEGVGRRTLALTFAQALICQQTGRLRPCGECSACGEWRAASTQTC